MNNRAIGDEKIGEILPKFSINSPYGLKKFTGRG